MSGVKKTAITIANNNKRGGTGDQRKNRDSREYSIFDRVEYSEKSWTPEETYCHLISKITYENCCEKPRKVWNDI